MDFFVKSFLNVTVGGESQRRNVAFGTSKGKDRLMASNCANLGGLLQSAPELFTDEHGEPLEAGKAHTEGWMGVGSLVTTQVGVIGAQSTQSASVSVTLPDGTVKQIAVPQGTPTAGGGNLP